MKALAVALFVSVLATTAQAQAVASAPGALVRWLDKVSGQTVDLKVMKGELAQQGRLSISLGDCRYPAADPASNAYAQLTVRDSLQPSGPIFNGWMIADSPALSALESARYDVWLLRCINS